MYSHERRTPDPLAMSSKRSSVDSRSFLVSGRSWAIAHSMQNFARFASKTLRQINAEHCRVPKKNLPARKEPPEELTSVRLFHANIRELFRAAQNGDRRITQRQFAKMAGMSLRTLGYILANDTKDADGEKQRYAPTLRTIERVAKGFRIDTWQLLFPDFPAELVLNETLRAQTQAVVRRALRSPAVRAALAAPQPSTE